MKNRKKQDNATAQSAIYVGFVDTPGLFASIIRRVIGQNYVHVVLVQSMPRHVSGIRHG